MMGMSQIFIILKIRVQVVPIVKVGSVHDFWIWKINSHLWVCLILEQCKAILS